MIRTLTRPLRAPRCLLGLWAILLAGLPVTSTTAQEGPLSRPGPEPVEVTVEAVLLDLFSVDDAAGTASIDFVLLMQWMDPRLRSDMRLRLLSKWQPDNYGDKVGIEHTGPGGGAIQVAQLDVSDLAKQMRKALRAKAEDAALPAPAKALPAADGSDVL